MEDWDIDIYTKGLDLVEASIRSAAQDSSNDTRSIGRSMFAAYTHAVPHKAQAFLKRMDTSLQEKLNQAVLTYVPGVATYPYDALLLPAHTFSPQPISTHLLTCSLTHSCTGSPTHSRTRSLNHSLLHSIPCSLASLSHSLTHSLAPLPPPLLSDSCVHETPSSLFFTVGPSAPPPLPLPLPA